MAEQDVPRGVSLLEQAIEAGAQRLWAVWACST